MRQGKLRAERVHRLDELGFVWDLRTTVWEEMFAALVAYRQRHGDFNVPVRWPENTALGTWVDKQRTLFNANRLRKDRVARLDDLGFAWNAHSTAWAEMLAALVAYKQQHGDCNVPQRWPENPALGTWVRTQRAIHAAAKLSVERIQRLDELGFVWDPFTAAWEETFTALVAYKQQHGDCNVPQKWRENPTLGGWVSSLRTKYRTGRLSQERIERLDALGFEWARTRAS